MLVRGSLCRCGRLWRKVAKNGKKQVPRCARNGKRRKASAKATAYSFRDVRLGLGVGPGPGFEVVAPGDAEAGEVVEAAAWVVLWVLGAVEEHQGFADARIVAQIEDEACGKASLGPRPGGLAEGEETVVAPGDEVG